MRKVPTGAQNFAEWLVESLYNFLEDIIGSHLVKRTFWLFATIFIFILAANWLSCFRASARWAGATRRPRAFGSRSRCSGAPTPT
jgi:F0F1-type ATP synthase membrane subunit a